MKRANFVGYGIRLLTLAAAVTVSASCGDLNRAGKSPVFLIMNSLTTSTGQRTLQSDVQVLVGTQATTGNDLGQASIGAAMKNTVTPTAPTAVNSITINRYRVTFRRADGRNTPGVDVPYGFDGGTTATVVVGGNTTVSFDLVRRQNKEEPPLRNLVAGGGLRVISMIAEVTFYGRDQTGNEVSVGGAIDIQFSDF
ncbi:MAG: hypothetical protein Q7R30_11205 [Acidobacteriota bacterium]|nr:hypothetical protein [Acidobacteriota bacterium]